MENPHKKFLPPQQDGEVRLKGAYICALHGFEKDGAGNITLIRCTYDPDKQKRRAIPQGQVHAALGERG